MADWLDKKTRSRARDKRMVELSYKVINEDEKEIEITYKNKTLRFKLNIKRSFTVLKNLLDSYPNFMNIHSLDSILSDPNRAHSDLRISDGFANFLIESKAKRNVMLIKLDLDNLFKVFSNKINTGEIVTLASSLREGLSTKEQDDLFKKSREICNITGIKLCQELEGIYFFKHALLATYDHRRPVSKGGSNTLSNWQIISKFANDEKNKICNTCDGKNCEKCALAFPEKYNIIQPNNQDISGLKRRN